jgi:hypothetical protein
MHDIPLTDYGWSKLSTFDSHTERSGYYSFKWQGDVYTLRLCIERFYRRTRNAYTLRIHRDRYDSLSMHIHSPKRIDDNTFRKIIERKINDLVSVYIEGIKDGQFELRD